MTRILFLTLAAAPVSCVPIDGGAVEANWVVFADDGRAISECRCADPAIAGVRIHLVGASGEVAGREPCQGRAACEFSCQSHRGATPFDIAPGSYLISVVPVGTMGQALSASGDAGPGPIQVPAPVLREVVRGQPTQLDAFAIVANCADACGGANRSDVCRVQ